MLVDLRIVRTTNMLLCHVHVLAVLHSLHHYLIQMITFDVELMQKIILIEVHHFLKDISLIQLLAWVFIVVIIEV